MSAKSLIIFVVLIGFIVGVYYIYIHPIKAPQNQNTQKPEPVNKFSSHPLTIEFMRQENYPGSEVYIEQTLTPGVNYYRYLASYKSQGLKIYSLLSVPKGLKPIVGWPVIIFNHGYIPPTQYQTTQRYLAYTDAFSRNGYIVFKPDYRGHGQSEGNPEGAYYSPAYTVDVLNALSSIVKYPDADPNRIGMWGHSMGGSITLRAMVVTNKIKAGVIWAGVVADYQDLTLNWHRSRPFMLSQREQTFTRPGRQTLINQYGDFSQNPNFWQSIAPINFVKDLMAPIQIHHGDEDQEVPILFSQRLDEALKKNGKISEYYSYPGDDHNLSNNLSLALDRSVKFFDKYLKINTP